jgi:hypothetical protein
VPLNLTATARAVIILALRRGTASVAAPAPRSSPPVRPADSCAALPRARDRLRVRFAPASGPATSQLSTWAGRVGLAGLGWPGWAGRVGLAGLGWPGWAGRVGLAGLGWPFRAGRVGLARSWAEALFKWPGAVQDSNAVQHPGAVQAPGAVQGRGGSDRGREPAVLVTAWPGGGGRPGVAAARPGGNPARRLRLVTPRRVSERCCEEVGRRRAGPSGVLFDAVGEFGDLVVEGAALGHVLADLAVGVHDRGVVAAAEGLADAG